MAMEDEGIDALEIANFLVGVGIGGGLEEFAVGPVGGMKTLLREDDAAGLIVVKELGALQESGELLDVFECDARCVGRVRGGFVTPGFAVKEIFRVRMERDVPIEIAAFFGAAGEVFDERARGECLLFVAAGVMNVPVVFEGEIDAGFGGMFADGGMGGADRAQVIVREFFHGRAAHVGPEPV